MNSRGQVRGSRITAIVGVALVLGILVSIIAVPVSADVISFPDPGLEAAIREAIGIPTGDIRDIDLVGLTYLEASERAISNLDGIQYCCSLTELLVNDNQIVDITPLSSLTNLTALLVN